MATPVLRVLVMAATLLACATATPQDPYARAAAARGEPVQAVYSDDLSDPWNRLFSAMFTRTVQHRKTAEFADAGPFAMLGENDFRLHPVSLRVFERLEDGDRPIHPFYPSFGVALDTPQPITSERLISFERLLTDALADPRARPALERVLMQADLWAVFDRLGTLDPQRPNRAHRLGPEIDRVMPLVARMIKQLALTRAEIEALPNQYQRAQDELDLPDLFSPGSAWQEIVWFDRRSHDDDVHFRQATRVFVRPSASVTDRVALLDDLRGLGHGRGPKPDAHAKGVTALSRLDGVALVMQMLALDTKGDVVPTRLVSTVQTRMFGSGGRTSVATEHELNRRLLRTRPDSGGMKTLRDADPGYIPAAGNDYSFASPHFGSVREPILGTLATRCSACHGSGPHMFTFGLLHALKEPPPVTLLGQPNETRARFVADKKKAREDYKSLRALMRK